MLSNIVQNPRFSYIIPWTQLDHLMHILCYDKCIDHLQFVEKTPSTPEIGEKKLIRCPVYEIVLDSLLTDFRSKSKYLFRMKWALAVPSQMNNNYTCSNTWIQFTITVHFNIIVTAFHAYCVDWIVETMHWPICLTRLHLPLATPYQFLFRYETYILDCDSKAHKR